MTTSTPTESLVVLPGSNSPCQQRLDEKRSWGRTLAVRTGPVVLGVRGDTDEGVDVLEAVLAPLRAPEYDHRVAPNFSVEIGSDAGPRRLFLGYRAHQVVARRRSRSDLLADVVTQLDDVARALSTSGLVLSLGAVSTPDDEVVLLPLDAHRVLLSRREQLAAEGVQLLPSQAYVYHPDHGAVTTELTDDGVRAACEGLGRVAEVDRMRVKAWCLPALGDRAFDMVGATALAAALEPVANREAIGMRVVLRALRAAVLRHRMVGMPTLSAGAQARAVLDLVR